MKILMVQKAKGFAGSERYLVNIIPKLKAKGIEAELLIIYEPQYAKVIQDFINPAQQANIIFHTIETVSNLSLRLLRQIHQIIKQNQYHIVHSHLPHADLWCALVKRLFATKFKLVSTKHSYDEAYANEIGLLKIKKRYDRFFWASWLAEKGIDRSFCVSQGLKRLFVALGICKANKVDVIPHGLLASTKKAQANSQLRFAKHQLIMVGRLILLKGHRFIIEVMPRLIERYGNDIHLLIAGDGPIKTELQQICKARGLLNHISFLGFRTDIDELIVSSDVSLCLSTSEGFGLVIVESFETGTPVVAFDVPACNEIIIDQKNGILIPPYKTDVLFNEIIQLLDNRAMGKALAQQALIDVYEKFSFDKMVDATIDFYNRVLN